MTDQHADRTRRHRDRETDGDTPDDPAEVEVTETASAADAQTELADDQSDEPGVAYQNPEH